MLVNPVEMLLLIDWLFVYHPTKPRITNEIPRVTMMELTPIRATVLPLDSPMAAPIRIGTATASTTGMPRRAMKPAHNTWTSPALLPTENSNSPQTSGIMMARARIPE